MSAAGFDRGLNPLRLVRVGRAGSHRPSRRDDAVLETFASQVLLLIGHPELFDPLSLERLGEWARGTLDGLPTTTATLADLLKAFRTLRPSESLECLMSAAASRWLLESLPIPDRSASRARQAWIHRRHLLSPHGRPAQAVQFLALVREHAREAYTVPQAAGVLCLGISTLRRLTGLWFSSPPGIIIDLCRILSVANEIRSTEGSIKAIAGGHGFRDASAMGRLFRRFVGVSPKAYRSGSRLLALSEIAQRLSETD